MMAPLFECVVEKSSTKMGKKDASYPGFLCTDIMEEALP